MTLYSLFGQPASPPGTLSATATFRAWGTDFNMSAGVYLTGIWVYSAPGATVLPSEIGIYYNADRGVIAGTHVTSPSWSGPAGSGWVKASFPSVYLDSPTPHRVVVGGAGQWLWSQAGYWTTAAAISNGPLSLPAATSNSYFVTSGPPISFPTTSSAINPWVDVEVSDTGTGPGPVTGSAQVALSASGAAAKTARGTASAVVSLSASAQSAKTGKGAGGAALSVSASAAVRKLAVLSGAAILSLSAAQAPAAVRQLDPSLLGGTVSRVRYDGSIAAGTAAVITSTSPGGSIT